MNVERCWAEIDLGALRGNVAAIRRHVGAGVQVMAVVKANAYGHGLEMVAEALADRVEMFGVANVAEARRLGERVAPGRVFVLGPALPEERSELALRGFVPAISNFEEAAAYSALARGGSRLPVHLAIDTGMGRMGVWQTDAVALATAIQKLPGVEIIGLASHLPVADEDDEYTRAELTRFNELVEGLADLGFGAALRHVENSAGLIRFPELAGGMVRAGILLYGSSPRPEFQTQVRPVLSWKTRVILVREVGAGRTLSYGRTFEVERSMQVASLAVGYADGFQRHLSNRGVEVLIGGHRCPVLGRVTMDQILADVSSVPEVEVGAEAVLIGRQGSEAITAAELAQKAGTIAWEIFTGLGPRVVRVAVNAN